MIINNDIKNPNKITISKEDIKRIKDNKDKIRRGWILPYPLTLEVIRYEGWLSEQRKNKWYNRIINKIKTIKIK